MGKSLHTNVPVSQRKAMADRRKNRFLSGYAEWGTIRKACEVAGIRRGTYDKWHADDIEFAKSVDTARRVFAEQLEEIALDRVRNPDKNRGSDVLLLGLLNANMPSKYRPQTAMVEDAAKDLILEWRKASQAVRKEKKAEPEENLSGNVEKTLAEILERRKNAPKEKEE